MADQRLLLDSVEACALAAEIFPGLRPLFANGQLPDDVRGAEHVLLMGTDAEWVESVEAMLRGAGSAVVRAGVGDFLTIDRDDPAAWLRGMIAAAPVVVDVEKESLSARSLGGVARSSLAGDPPDWHTEIPHEAAEVATKPHRPRKRPRLAAVDGNLARAPDPDSDPLPASLSEDALAEHFVETQGNNWRHVPEWGLWLRWMGDSWHRDTLHAVAHQCKLVTREALEWSDARTLTPDGRRKISSRRMAWACRDMAAVHPKISILAAELDSDPWLLGIPGGVVDLKTGKEIEPLPEQYVTRRTLVAPEPGPHPLFDRVLERACNGHDGMREYLIRCMGYALTGLCTEEVFFYLVGAAGSGKGSLTGALQDIWGDYADTIAMDALIETKQHRHTQEIAKLEGMRLVLASEAEEGVRFNSALIQRLTGSDVITANRMRMDDHSYRPQFKLLLSGNSTPHIKSVSDGAMKRRIHLIEYAPSIAEEDRDTTLKTRMIDEYPAILHTLIQGCVDWQDCHGLGKPESVIASVETYLEGEDSFAEFMLTCTESDAVARTQTSECYRRYSTWAHSAGEYVMSQKRFVQTLRLRGFDTARTAQGRVISGLKLRPQAPAESQDRPHWQRD